MKRLLKLGMAITGKFLKLTIVILDSPATYPVITFYLVACVVIQLGMRDFIDLSATMIILAVAVVVLVLIAFLKSLTEVQVKLQDLFSGSITQRDNRINQLTNTLIDNHTDVPAIPVTPPDQMGDTE